jgi:hypothetical protein
VAVSYIFNTPTRAARVLKRFATWQNLVWVAIIVLVILTIAAMMWASRRPPIGGDTGPPLSKAVLPSNGQTSVGRMAPPAANSRPLAYLDPFAQPFPFFRFSGLPKQIWYLLAAN